MHTFKRPADAAIVAAARCNRFWTDRLADMMRHACTVDVKTDGSTPCAEYRVKVDRVAKAWPAKGSVFVTRNDGKRFRLYATKAAFKVVAA